MPQFDHPGQDGSMDLGFGPDPQRASPDNSEQGSGTVTLSQEQFQAMLDRISGSQERDYADALGEVVGQPAPAPQNNLVDLSQLPDPRMDPDGFKAGLSNVLNQAGNTLLEVSQQRSQAAQNQVSTLDTAWNMFRDNYGDVAEHTDIVELAATREMAALRARGIDPMVALSQNMEGFVDAVANRAQISINKIRGMSEEEAGEAADGNDRTEMLSGGSPRPGKSNTPSPVKGGLVDELKAIQRAMGHY